MLRYYEGVVVGTLLICYTMQACKSLHKLIRIKSKTFLVKQKENGRHSFDNFEIKIVFTHALQNYLNMGCKTIGQRLKKFKIRSIMCFPWKPGQK